MPLRAAEAVGDAVTTDAPSASQEPRAASHGERFFQNVLWNWLGVASQVFGGIVLSPYIIRKLGADGYGIWALVFSITGYYGLLDFGFRSAVVNFSADFAARKDSASLNELVNTVLAFFTPVSAILITVSIVFSGQAHRLFNVPPHYVDQFGPLVALVGTSIAIGFTFNLFSGCVEGFQRFDLSNRIWLVSFGIRYPGCALLIYLGYGLVEMGILALATQILSCILYLIAFRSIFPTFRLSLQHATRRMLHKVAGYGIHTFVGGLATQSLEQSPSLLIGVFMPVAYVGYYVLPLRLLQYAAEAVTRVGLVVAPKTAELAAQGRQESVFRLASYVNRYCFAMYLCFTMPMLLYGSDLLRLWLKERGPEFVLHSAPLLPVFLAATTLTLAGQYSSGSVLFGLGKHRGFAWGMVAEAALGAGAMVYMAPRYGIMGVALVSVTLMVLVRGTLTPWLVCHSLGKSFLGYMRSIYVPPLLTALPVFLCAWWIKAAFLPGRTWLDLITASALIAIPYLGAAAYTCLAPEHRALLFRRLGALRA